MRNMFSGYYRPSDEDFKKLWAEAVFVFDTNVLLNLYSYPEDVRNVFLSVLSKIEGRIWIPYHVGLEFHRNRFARIKQANQRVEKLLQTIRSTGDQLGSEVQSIELEKRNIGLSDIQDRLLAVQGAHKALSDAVQLACDKLPPISLDDPIGLEICELLDGRVGSPPKDQAALDSLLADAQVRYDKKIPPGFADQDKGDDSYRDRELTYQRKYGDLILWHQVMNYAKENGVKNLVFVTGDKKKDWWLLDESKTLGPLPELVQEIKTKASVELFWMYSADQFLVHAEVHLKATEVTAEAVEQVKEVSAQNLGFSFADLIPRTTFHDHSSSGGGLLTGWSDQTPISVKNFDSTLRDAEIVGSQRLLDRFNTVTVEGAVQNWLVRTNPGCRVIQHKDFPDFIVDSNGILSGFETKLLRNFSPRAFPPYVVNSLMRGYLEVHQGRLHEFSLVLVLPIDELDYFRDEDLQYEVSRRGRNLLQKYPAHSIIMGAINGDIFDALLVIEG